MTVPFSQPTPLTPRKKAILVGASRGLGAAIARQLASEGYLIALLSRSSEDLKSLSEAINQTAGDIVARVYHHDLKNSGEVESLLARLISDLGGLDLFIFNSGILNHTALDEFNFASDQEMIEVNLIGALAWLNPVAKVFQSLGRGHIVGISSVAGDRGRILNPAYGASKAGLSSILESYRNRLTRKGIHVLTVKPGFLDTNMTKGRTGLLFMTSPEDAASQISKAIRTGKQTVYISPIWGIIMMTVRLIPSFIFRKLSF